DRSEAAAAADAAGALVERAAALQRGAAPAVRPVVAAYEALCRAECARAGRAHEALGGGGGERGRAAGTGDRQRRDADAESAAAAAEAWAAAAERWAALGQPYPAAYARFREAEAILATQARSARAAKALRAADKVARRLGADPFRREIEALARRARLTPAPPEDEPAADRRPAAAPVGTAASAAAGPLDA